MTGRSAAVETRSSCVSGRSVATGASVGVGSGGRRTAATGFGSWWIPISQSPHAVETVPLA